MDTRGHCHLLKVKNNQPQLRPGWERLEADDDKKERYVSGLYTDFGLRDTERSR